MSEEFRVGEDRLVCDQWHARDRTVVLRPRDPATPVRADSVTQVLQVLTDRGVHRVLTAALPEPALAPFRPAGFRPHQALCVLRHRLDHRIDDPDGDRDRRVRRARARRDGPRAARIDQAAFPAGDALDEHGLQNVLAATSITRFRMATGPDGVAGGYAVCGIAADRGYVQRIAVDPDQRRRGLARALVVDALGWLQRRRVTEAFVNTQVDNTAARALYRSTGFEPTRGYLAVWVWHRGVTP